MVVWANPKNLQQNVFERCVDSDEKLKKIDYRYRHFNVEQGVTFRVHSYSESQEEVKRPGGTPL